MYRAIEVAADHVRVKAVAVVARRNVGVEVQVARIAVTVGAEVTAAVVVVVETEVRP